jgi:predicted RNase H-like nuclease
MSAWAVVAVGVDACKTGWIAVALNVDHAGPGDQRPHTHHDVQVDAYYLPTIGALTSVIAEPQAIAIDIPIGLPAAGRRQADVVARLFLGPRRNSIFFAPVRAAVQAVTHQAATTLQQQATGSGLSQQSYRLAQKILEVEAWLPHAPCSVWEVSPELSFALLIGQPADAPKKTWAGMVQRRRALLAAGINVDGVGGPAGSRASVDDMLDAAAAAWTARRLLRGCARSFPDPPGAGPNGRSVAIWA